MKKLLPNRTFARYRAYMIENNQTPKSQFRYDPFLKEWVAYAPARGNRPFQGKSFLKEEKKTWTCPFCPDAPEGAGVWTVKQLPNRFAALDENAFPFNEQVLGPFFKNAPNYGKCEVILYSQDHNQSFGNLTKDNIIALLQLWQERYQVLSKIPGIVYPFIMENRGKEIGNSMSHPHGQIYAFPVLPPKISRELASVVEYHQKLNKCLMCDILNEELREKVRIIDENESFVSLIPYFAHWMYEVHIIGKKHVSSIDELTVKDLSDLADIMKSAVRRYDALIGDGKLMPYVMAMHNAPCNIIDREKWHFHIEFYTPFRGKDRWKFLAGVELGTNMFLNDSIPETSAAEMRNLTI